MARVLVLTDRSEEDSDWKGAVLWQIVLSLAESQHEVLAVTPQQHVTATHPRLTLAHAVKSWRATEMPRLARVLFTFQPQILHIFAVCPSSLWPALSVWPYLAAAAKVFPGLRTVSTLFDAEDAQNPARAFYTTCNLVTAFSEGERLEATLQTAVKALPLELDLSTDTDADTAQTVVPAPVSEWHDPEQSIEHLRRYLEYRPTTHVSIVGGWGEWTSSQRKHAWTQLGKAGARVRLLAPLSFGALKEQLVQAEEIWLEPLRRGSWRYVLSSSLADALGKRLVGDVAPQLSRGSTANSLSRLYSL